MTAQQTEFPHEFVLDYLALIAQHVPGDITLNQLRILHYIDMRTAQQHGHTSHTEICAALNMSAATVSRAIASFIDAGIVREEADDWDARRRQVRLSEQFSQGHTLDRQIIELARSHFRR